MKKIVAGVLGLLFAGVVFAAEAGGYTNAGALSGPERFLADQGGAALNPTSAQILSYVGAKLEASPNTWTGVQTFNSPILVTPNLGVPGSLTLTNALGLPCSALPAVGFPRFS